MSDNLSGINWLESLLQQQNGQESTAGDVTALTTGDVTPIPSELTPEAVTPSEQASTLQSTPKRAYKPRARRCACGCGQMVTPTSRTPNKRFFNDTCRQRDRRARMAKQLKADPKPVADRRELCLCLWCGVDFLADPTKHPKYHQDGSCKELAYRQRKHSAIETVATIKGWAYERAEAAVKRDGMTKVSGWLKRQGYQYDEHQRCWLLPVAQGSIFVGIEQG